MREKPKETEKKTYFCTPPIVQNQQRSTLRKTNRKKTFKKQHSRPVFQDCKQNTPVLKF